MEQVAELIKKSQAGDRQARDKLIADNLGLVYSVVARFAGRGHDREELVQIGSIGLIKAIDKFDCSYEEIFHMRFRDLRGDPAVSGDDGPIKVSRSKGKTHGRSDRRSGAGYRSWQGSYDRGVSVRKTGIDREDIVMALDAAVGVDL